MYKEITSIKNPLVKEILQLQEKSRVRKKLGLCIVEGKREITLAQQANYKIETLLYFGGIFDEYLLDVFNIENQNIIKVSKEVYQKIAFRDTTEGVIAIIKTKALLLDKISFGNKNPLILIAEAPEKPGNIGALLRTADAANLDAVIIANPKTDMYNPNIIRSSVGCVFTNQIAIGSSMEIIEFLKENNIHIYCASLQGSVDYHSQNFTETTAIVVGTESTGLSDEWLHNSKRNISIPMQGQIDSLNVSVAAAVLIFEAKRQRNFK